MKVIILVLLFILTSCANYVNQLHRQFDKDEKRAQRKSEPPPPMNRFGPQIHEKNRFRTDMDKRPIKNPITYSLGNGPSGQVRPPVKRDYRQQRMKADDFQDNDSAGSLWADQGQSSSLFTYQNDKHTGDMVIINVLENLRNQISSELKRSFPDKPKKKKEGEKEKPEKVAATPPPAENQPNNDQEMDMKVYDKISGVVAEEISKDYIVLRGRKEVIFKKEKRSIEIQALVSRKDIMENDFVNSDKLLESRVFILRNEQ